MPLVGGGGRRDAAGRNRHGSDVVYESEVVFGEEHDSARPSAPTAVASAVVPDVRVEEANRRAAKPLEGTVRRVKIPVVRAPVHPPLGYDHRAVGARPAARSSEAAGSGAGAAREVSGDRVSGTRLGDVVTMGRAFSRQGWDGVI
ncbi:hypothetical protein, partial [Frankia gtarii]|uniref:hypothetical protein n=1 Tax=Frankia gtarii TaxID=2950102 RepID=UPI0021BE92B4